MIPQTGNGKILLINVFHYASSNSLMDGIYEKRHPPIFRCPDAFPLLLFKPLLLHKAPVRLSRGRAAFFHQADLDGLHPLREALAPGALSVLRPVKPAAALDVGPVVDVVSLRSLPGQLDLHGIVQESVIGRSDALIQLAQDVVRLNGELAGSIEKTEEEINSGKEALLDLDKTAREIFTAVKEEQK